MRAATVTADRTLNDRLSLRLGLQRSFEADRSTTAEASAVFRLPFADVSIDGNYTEPHHAWRLGVAFAFSLGWDPLSHHYAARRIGAGSGGDVALQAFVDANGNGRYDEGEKPVAGVALSAGLQPVTTGTDGRAYLTGLGYGALAHVQLNVDNANVGNMAPTPTAIEFTPRPGVAAVAMYPIQASGEVLVRLLFSQSGGIMAGLSAVHLRAVPRSGTTIEVNTEYDGSAVFENLPSGTYRIEIDPVQAKRLDLHFRAPLTIIVPPGGGVLPDQQATVEIGMH